MRGTSKCLAAIAAAAFVAPPVVAQDYGVPESVLAECGGNLSVEDVSALSDAERTTYVACGLRGLADTLNADVPREAGPGVTVTGFSARGMVLTIRMAIDPAGEEVAPDGLQAMSEALRERTCAGDRALIEVGGAYRYVWTLPNGEQIGEMTVDSCDNVER